MIGAVFDEGTRENERVRRTKGKGKWKKVYKEKKRLRQTVPLFALCEGTRTKERAKTEKKKDK